MWVRDMGACSSNGMVYLCALHSQRNLWLERYIVRHECGFQMEPTGLPPPKISGAPRSMDGCSCDAMYAIYVSSGMARTSGSSSLSGFHSFLRLLATGALRSEHVTSLPGWQSPKVASRLPRGHVTLDRPPELAPPRIHANRKMSQQR